jgi:hypothetical protein
MSNYEKILPPTIAKKKHDSERKIPTRKRTAPVDMRLSRSRISIGADAKQLLAAQQAAQNPSLSRMKSPPPVPPLPPTLPRQESVETAGGPKPFIAPPPPPPVSNQAKVPSPRVPPPPPLPTHSTVSANEEAPPRPTFKEPPPELDDLPPRPTFKEPPPEDDDYTPPPMPKFVDPPTEETNDASSAKPTAQPTPPTTNIVPPSPLKRANMGNTGRTTPSNASVTSRSPSPASEDVVLGSGKTTIARTGSSQSNGGLRGPRLARGPARRGGNVASAIANLNRNSASGPPGPGSTGSPSTSSNRFSAGSPTRRPSSVLGRPAAPSRRMTSDPEDDPFDKK